MTTQYIRYEDPGHSWLKVSRTELQQLNIADKISGWSYADSENVYLEEDCDMSIFLIAKGITTPEQYQTQVKKEYTDNQSWIRTLRGYHFG